MKGYFNIRQLVNLVLRYNINADLFTTKNFKKLLDKKYKCNTCMKNLTCDTAWTVKWYLPFDKNTFCKECAIEQKIIEAI